MSHGLIDLAAAMVDRMEPIDQLGFDAAFEAWASEGQRCPPEEGWRVWCPVAGRGFGKTRAGAEWVHGLAMARRCRIALVGSTIDDARRVMVEGVSGLLAVAKLGTVQLKWEPSQRKLTWPNGTSATIFSGEDGDGLRGPEHDFAWCDELAKWGDPENTWDNLQLGLRRGRRPRVLVTTTPRPMALLGRLFADPLTVRTGGRTDDNINLSAGFAATMRATYGETQLARQELDGEMLEEAEGSLWPRAMIERCRVTVRTLPDMERVVVGVDPPAGAKATCDACGIIVAGRAQGRYYVLADASVKGASSERWAAAVRGATVTWRADKIVAEANNGAAMVASMLKAAGIEPGLVTLVHALGEAFVLIEPERLARIALPVEMIGASITAIPHGLGDAATSATVRVAGGEALRPPSPCALRAVRSAIGVSLSWTRRSRSGWGWADGVDAPLGETSEVYRVRLIQGGLEAVWGCATPQLTIANSELVRFASGAASAAVCQLGDRAASRDILSPITL